MDILLEKVCYRSDFMLGGFIILAISINTNRSTFVISSSSNDSLVHDVK